MPKDAVTSRVADYNPVPPTLLARMFRQNDARGARRRDAGRAMGGVQGLQALATSSVRPCTRGRDDSGVEPVCANPSGLW
jgi:hypothetical protein